MTIIESESKVQKVPVTNLSNSDKKIKYIIAINKIAKRNDLDIVFLLPQSLKKLTMIPIRIKQWMKLLKIFLSQ